MARKKSNINMYEVLFGKDRQQDNVKPSKQQDELSKVLKMIDQKLETFDWRLSAKRKPSLYKVLIETLFNESKEGMLTPVVRDLKYYAKISDVVGMFAKDQFPCVYTAYNHTKEYYVYSRITAAISRSAEALWDLKVPVLVVTPTIAQGYRRYYIPHVLAALRVVEEYLLGIGNTLDDWEKALSPKKYVGKHCKDKGADNDRKQDFTL